MNNLKIMSHEHHHHRPGKQQLVSAEQIVVKGDLTKILLDFSKEIILHNPRDIYQYSRNYFEEKLRATGYFLDHTEKLEVEAKKLIYRIGEDINDYYKLMDKISSSSIEEGGSKVHKALHKITGEIKAVKI